MPAPRRSRLPRRELIRDSDGTLRDVSEQRRIGVDELRDDLRAGRYFRARTMSTGVDCTYEVLGDVLLGGALPTGSSGAGLAGLVSLVRVYSDATRDVGSDDVEWTGRRSNDRRGGRRKLGGEGPFHTEE